MNFINIKKRGLGLAVMLIAVLSFGCGKYLDQKPSDSLTRQEFFKNEADANAAMIGVYDALQGCVTQFLSWGEYRGDLISPTIQSTTNYPYYEAFSSDNTTNISSASDWSAVYKMIGRANIVIESVPGIVGADQNFTQAKSDAIVGQARFLRALGYFYLVRTFKEVPLILSASSNDDVNFRLPKSSADVILDQIETDLSFAEGVVPAQYSTDQATRGTATKGAINALQTDVYLWRAKYQQAVDASQKLLNNSLYTLVPGSNWFSLFAQKNTSESIFEVQYDYKISETNGLRGVSGNFIVNPGLVSSYTIEQDKTRGLNYTYVNAGSNVFWKYTGLSVNGTTNIGRPTDDPDFIIYRLADVMLLRAEALTHLGVTQKQEAIDIINAIRTRAGIANYVGVDGSASTALLQSYVLKERGLELAMEGKRWFDLVREATNDNNPDLLINAVALSRTVAERALIRSRIIDPRSWYLPILSTELNKNPLLVQNPYYL
ncbi:RagB/SusD family nutrient uptake outer membrane protein [Mucilaginibacter sp. HMF5004]|uniref:RagB/SusD family nutrient uptake outer membrane protein n=1 Tax=Mucilaginibacter rivuli TaxID=2857527 RepID=UPI001C5DCD3F|nr:RagB/SusD family nutrient uptake outer membrane protein [Mucilaginibacter rivuli]MBW4888510.1 RagB/SusD family nutrient uptake outer membrane protein [Mucilaginibacter rivuli]